MVEKEEKSTVNSGEDGERIQKNSGKHLEGKIQKVGLRLVWFKGIGSH